MKTRIAIVAGVLALASTTGTVAQAASDPIPGVDIIVCKNCNRGLANTKPTTTQRRVLPATQKPKIAPRTTGSPTPTGTVQFKR